MGDEVTSEELQAKTLLRQRLYFFPSQYGTRHDKIASMRFELRCWILRELTGEFSNRLFGKEEIRQRAFLPPDKWLPFDLESSHSHHGRPCARKLERGEPTHRCLTCGLDDTCVLCKYCFNPADHEGHNVFVKISSRDDGGICDCGDAEAWKRKVNCLSDRGPPECRPLPDAFSQRISIVLDVMFDYVVDVLAGASLATQTSKSEAAIWRLSEASELNNEAYSVPPRPSSVPEGKKWCLLVWDDDKRSVTDLRSSLQLATERSDDFMQMIMRRIQSSGRATVAISSSLPEMISMRKKIKHFTTSIRSVEDVMREEMVLEIIDVALDLCHCSIDGAEPTALVKLVGQALLKDWNVGAKSRDDMLSELLLKQRPDNNPVVYAMSDLQDSNQRIPDSNWERHIREELGDDSDDMADTNPQESDEELFGPRNVFGQRAQDLSEFLQQEANINITSWPIEKSNARVKYLVFFDVRLYKSLRQKLTDLYVAALVSNPQLKLQMAAVYADVYPSLVDQYTHIDHDPDVSVTTALSTQLFTTPSIATALMETDAFAVYVNMLYHLFAKKGRLNPKVFRNRRLGQVFHEFGYLLWRNTKKECVGSDPRRLAHTASFLALFQGLAPMQRQIDQHVEYENERWVYCYATMPFALQLARSVAVGIDHSVKHGSGAAEAGLQKVAKGLLHWQHALEDDIGTSKAAYDISYGPLKDIQWILSGVNSAKDPVSLLHPVHCFLSWLIQLSTINDAGKLRDALLIDKPYDCTLFDAPMCTLAVLCQISVGYWVRNGYAMRVQLQCYRDATLRDLSYSRDIFLTQVALCILNPNSVFMNLVHHFGIENWPESTLGDEQQSYYIFDEFLHCLTFLLCDRLKFQGLEGVEFKRASLVKEILQVLGFETMPYSELTRLVPESMIVDEHFDMVLSECADFTPPRGAHGVGLYSLKPKHYADFDPHYTHYTIARTEEAEKAAEAKLGNTHLPPLLPLEGAWANLGNFTRCAAFARFIFISIHKLLQADASQAEQTLGRILHLLLMSAKNDMTSEVGNSSGAELNGCFNTVAEMVLSPSAMQLDDGVETGDSILTLLYRIIEKKSLSALHSRTESLLNLLHQKDRNVAVPSVSFSNGSIGTATEEQIKRRERGKAMQEKVLAEFTQQQNSFLQANMMVDDDSESEESAAFDEDTTKGFSFPRYCVLCRMPDDEESIFGVLTYTSQIKILRDLPDNDPYWVKQSFSGDPSLDVEHAPQEPVPDYAWHEHKHEEGESVVWGPAFPNECVHETSIVQGCGHGVHYKCFQAFLRNQQQQRVLTRFTPENLADGEFLCPLCRGLNNCFMPVLWSTNTLDAEHLLKLPENPKLDMQHAIDGSSQPARLDVIVENALSTLNTKFLSAIRRHDFSDSFHSNVRNVLLEQMLRIKRMSTKMKDLDKTYGLRMVYRTLACTISQIEIALRGKGHSTPFGGLVVDQLPARTTQILRIFAKYINTLTGFIMSSFIQLGKELEIDEEVSITPDETLTKLVEMMFFGIPLNGVSPVTILIQAIVTELDRVFANVHSINISEVNFDDAVSDISPELAAALALWAPDQDPRIVYGIIRYHMTTILRQYALLVFSICGKYDPDDFVGMMDEPEHDRLLSYLQLPKLTDIILNLGDPNTPEGMMQLSYVQRQTANGVSPFNFKNINYTGLYRLIPLPNRLDAMFNIKGRKIPIDPTVCLLCGHMCCIQSSEFGIGDLGPCNEHMSECGVTLGLYLLPRRNYVLLLLPHGRGTFIPAPYLDLHGEPDENMRRGRPHYLQPLRYDALTREVWLNNGLPSLVARKLDQNQDTGGWDTL